MGYTTNFDGKIRIEPPLSQEEVKFLNKFNSTRRMDCKQGPYYVDRGGFHGQDHSDPLKTIFMPIQAKHSKTQSVLNSKRPEICDNTPKNNDAIKTFEDIFIILWHTQVLLFFIIIPFRQVYFLYKYNLNLNYRFFCSYYF